MLFALLERLHGNEFEIEDDIGQRERRIWHSTELKSLNCSRHVTDAAVSATASAV